MNPIRLATRKSQLAIKQTELVREWLAKKLPDAGFEMLPMSTSGDRQAQWSLEQKGGKGLFTKELEDALLGNAADLAVHSAKDLPTEMPEGLTLAGFLPRARAKDVLVRREEAVIPEVIATSSPRRRAQVKHLYPKAVWTTIRGNVRTRLEKVQRGDADATILAAAGLERLEIHAFEGLVFETFDLGDVVPPPGQAAIGIQCRAADADHYAPLFCAQTHLAVSLERAFLRRLGGGCQTPIGAHYENGRFHLFHPDKGYVEIGLEYRSVEQLDDALERILRETGL